METEVSARNELFPAFAENNVPIALPTSDSYVPYYSVLLQSIADTSSDKNNYDIVVMHLEVSENSMRLMRSIVAGRKNFSLRFVNVSDIFEGRDMWTYTAKHRTTNIFNYLRITIPEVFRNYKKAIYLDGDIIFRTDIAGLMDFELGDAYLAAARDTITISVYHKWLATRDSRYYRETPANLSNPDGYFCDALMIMNTAKIRRDFPLDDMFTWTVKKPWRVAEQDMFNCMFDGHVVYLPFEWGTLLPTRKNMEMFLPKELYDSWLCALKKPNAVHYGGGGNLPTQSPYILYQDYFWESARKTPYYEVLIAMMTENIIKREIAKDKEARQE